MAENGAINAEFIKTLYDIKERTIRIEEGMKGVDRLSTDVDRLSDKVDQVDKEASKALQSTISAHKRLDDLNPKEMSGVPLRVTKIEKIVFWLGTTFIGSIIVGGVSAFFYYAKQ